MSEEIMALRRMRDALHEAKASGEKAAAIDMLATGPNYEVMLSWVTLALDETEAFIDTREWADVDGRTA